MFYKSISLLLKLKIFSILKIFSSPSISHLQFKVKKHVYKITNISKETLIGLQIIVAKNIINWLGNKTETSILRGNNQYNS